MRRRKIGKVVLVGAGPGHPGLMTLAGYEYLRTADVIVIDALVSRELLKGLRARIIDVGKRGPGAPSGASHEMVQEKINKLLVRLGKQGHRVVRLKGGDPFVFGRGSEELEALREAGIPADVIPGVSSVTAVPAWAGVPVTDRRVASQLTILTGHEGKKKRAGSPGVDWKSLTPKGTLVILMGVGMWPHIRRRLLANGWSKNVAVAAIESGTTDEERVIESTLDDSANAFAREHLIAPAIIVVGDVVRMRHNSIVGKKIVVTRPLTQNAGLIALLEKIGARPVAAPVIKIEPIRRSPKIAALAKNLSTGKSRYDWLVFTSVNAAKSLRDAVGKAARHLNKTPKIAVGPQTETAVRSFGWKLARSPKQFNSDGLLAALGNVRGKRVLIPRVQNAPVDFVNGLKKKGAQVDQIETYRTVPVKLTSGARRQLDGGVDAVVFTSSSTVKNFVGSYGKKQSKTLFARAAAVSVGPQTTATLRRHGIENILEAADPTKESIVRVLIDRFNAR